MLSLLRALLLAAALAAPVTALDYPVNDFLPDFSGQAADTLSLDPAWGDTLKIAAKLHRYTPLPPFNLSDSVANNGLAGGTPVVVSPGKGLFRTGYVAWDVGHIRRDANNNIHPRANVVVRATTVKEGFVAKSDGIRIAGNENASDLYGGPQSPDRPPTYFNYVSEGSRYAAYWGSLDPGAYVRRTTHKDSVGGGSPDNWGKYLFVSPGDPVNVGGYGELSATVIPGTAGARTVLAYEGNLVSGNYLTEIRWEDLEAGTYASTTFSRATYGEDYAITADTAGNVALLWREGSSLYVTAYDAARAVAQAPTLVSAGITYKDAANDHYYRPYAIAAVSNGRFLVAYTRAGGIQLRSLDIPFGAVPYSLSAETQLTAAGTTVNYPSIAVNHNMALVGWFKRLGGVDSLVGALFDHTGTGASLTNRRDMPLSSETISFSAVGGGWYFYHYFKAPSLALDSVGNIAAAYDNQFWAKLAVTSNFAVFHDSAVFVSKAKAFSDIAAPLPFLDASDSLEYLGYRVVTTTSDGSPARVDFKLSISEDGSFTDPGSGFQDFPVGRKADRESFKYRLSVQANGPNFVTQTKVDSLILRYNVQPRRPAVDSIRIGTAAQAAYDGAAAYVVMTRKDSLHLTVSGIDLENQPSAKLYLYVAGRAVDSLAAPRASPARYRARFSFKPSDTLPDPLPLAFRMRDSSGWLGLPLDFAPAFRNRPPAETLSVIRNRGKDSADIFWPSRGGADTLAMAPSQLLVLQTGDTATARVRLGDPNDDTVAYQLIRNGVTVASGRQAVLNPLSLRFAADTLPPLVDTLTVAVSDPDTTVTLRFLVRPNRLPAIDSLYLAAYLSKAGARQAGPFEVIRDFAADSGLPVPSGLAAVLRAGASDRDIPLGDGVRLTWGAFRPQAGCPAGDLSCYARTALSASDSLAHAFALPEEYVTLRATDSTGAFLQRRVRLEFPMLDTASVASFQTAVKALAEDLDFILEGEVGSRTVQAEIASQGNVALQILSVTTARNDRKWLDLRLAWESPGTPPRKDSLRISGRTDSNAVPAGQPLAVAVGSRLALNFTVSSDSLRGDSVLTDTLVLRTNDLANPFILIPIRVVYNDLPVMRLSHQGGTPGPAGGFNDGGLPRLLPVRSQIVVAFSETVLILDPARFLRVYSYLDSLKNPGGFRDIPGVYDYRRRALAKTGGQARPASSAWAAGSARLYASAAADSLADTLIFRPVYDRASDSLKVRPAPGAFIHRDVLRIAVKNAVTDKAGNTLDLRLDRRPVPPGSLDTVWSAPVDTGYFRVVSTVPAAAEGNWDIDRGLRVRFNRRLGLRPPRGQDPLTFLELDALRADSNQGVWVRSTSRGARKYDFHFLAVEDGDSTLVFRTRPKFAAFDTVTVNLSGGLADIDGLTLDGNRDGFPGVFYDRADTSDDFRFTFHTREQSFYVFPNPYRHGNPRHREKGNITFKNINSLSGFIPGREVVLRVHAMDGNLVYSSRTTSRPQALTNGYSNLEWDLRNTAGSLAGTGVYIYTLMHGEDKVIRKGKVAVIR